MEHRMCFLCFDLERPTIDITNTYLHDFYERIAKSKIGSSHPLCYICHRRLQQSYQLVQLAQSQDETYQQNNPEDHNNCAQGSLLDMCKTVYNYSMPDIKEEFLDKEITEENFVKKENTDDSETDSDSVYNIKIEIEDVHLSIPSHSQNGGQIKYTSHEEATNDKIENIEDLKERRARANERMRRYRERKRIMKEMPELNKIEIEVLDDETLRKRELARDRAKRYREKRRDTIKINIKKEKND